MAVLHPNAVRADVRPRTCGSIDARIGRVDAYRAAVLGDAPIIYFRLDEASGATVGDTSGSANNGTIVGTPSYGASGLIVPVDAAMSFAGAPYITCVPGSPATLNAPYTVEAWFKPSAASGTYCVFSTRGPSDNSFDLQVAVAGHFTIDIGTGTTWLHTSLVGATTFAQNSIYHIVVVVTATGVTVYVNNTVDATTTWASSTPLLFDATHTIEIGRNHGFSQLWQGVLDEIAVYNTALSATQVQAHYNAGIGV